MRECDARSKCNNSDAITTGSAPSYSEEAEEEPSPLTPYGFVYEGVRMLLKGIEGISAVEREGLKDTPARVARMYTQEICSGYGSDIKSILDVTFSEDFVYDAIVVASFPFYSLCEHHMMPFFGTAYIGYLPNTKVTGLSKLGRLLDVFAKRLQIQERLTSEIVDALQEHLAPLGCGCVIEAQHLCTEMRGVSKAGSKYITSALRGNFLEDSVKAEFMGFVDRLSA